MKIVGIVSARAGSKRVPNKNIKPLHGKPLIGYTIEAALASTLLDRVIVSTDGAEIADVAASFGAAIPFMRPDALAQDDTPDKPVFRHALEWLKNNDGYAADAVVILRPTTPFKTAALIDEVIAYYQSTGAGSVRTVTKAEGVYHPYWMYNKDADGRASSFVEGVDISQYYQSQLLPDAFRLNGVVDIVNAAIVSDDSDSLYGDDMRIYEIPEAVSMDIDTEMDFKICESIMEKRS
ncbi:MAG: acylneuraminate cytidylyltransferase family protein [Flavobacteriales bacterium]|nr:acylneuraminate cytidylyltransferase family protein [Flavobacteriales bacterium]